MTWRAPYKKGCDGSESTPCTWLIKYESSSYNVRVGLENAPTGVVYVICLYWALGEITGIGDLPGPTNTTERLYLTFVNIFCVFVNAMIIGGVVSIIEAINTRKKAGPRRCCSPRHRMPINAINKGSKPGPCPCHPCKNG